MKTILEHPMWEEVKPYFRLDFYKKQNRADGQPRFRIDIKKAIPEKLLKKALKIRVECCACGKKIRPIRNNETRPAYVYFGCTCDKDKKTHFKCRNSRAARIEYDRMKACIQGDADYLNPDPAQETLF